MWGFEQLSLTPIELGDNLSTFFFALLSDFSRTPARCGIRIGLKLENFEKSPTLRTCISELNEDFLKIPKDLESSRLDLRDNAILRVFCNFGTNCES